MYFDTLFLIETLSNKSIYTVKYPFSLIIDSDSNEIIEKIETNLKGRLNLIESIRIIYQYADEGGACSPFDLKDFFIYIDSLDTKDARLELENTHFLEFHSKQKFYDFVLTMYSNMMESLSAKEFHDTCMKQIGNMNDKSILTFY